MQSDDEGEERTYRVLNPGLDRGQKTWLSAPHNRPPLPSILPPG